VRVLRRVTHINDDISTVDSSTQILVSDTGNDQTLLTSVWTILERTGCEVTMIAKLRDEDGRCYAAYAHEALYDSNPAQTESLSSVHQSLRDTRNGIDDRAR
jgi:hypothetical protein